MNHLILITMQLLLLVGCGLNGYGQASADSMQDVRKKTVLLFLEHPDVAKNKYRDQLVNATPTDDKRITIEYLAAAGQLIRLDFENADAYARYISHHLDSRDREVEGVAVSALAGHKTMESLDIIFEKLSSDSDYVRIEATSALQYRYVAALADPSQAASVQIIQKRLTPLCVPEIDKIRPTQELCRRVGFYRA